MAHTIHDAAGKPDAALLDAEECVWIAATLQQFLTSEQSRQRKPSLTFPAVILRALAALEPVAARHRVSADGHTDETPTRDLAGGGHAAPVVDHLDGIVGVMDIATELGISRRQAQRLCERVGRKVGTVWVTTRAAIEKVS